MKIQGKIKFKDAIVVDEKLLRELTDIILSFYKYINFSCFLCNDSKIEFDTLDELLDFDNNRIRKIERMSISFGYSNEIVFKPTIGIFSSYKYTVEGTYITEKYDEGILFHEKIRNALDKNKQSKWYTIITKISILYFCIAVSSFFLGYTIASLYAEGINASPKIQYTITDIALSITIGLILILLAGMLSKFRNVLLPPIVYKIGEQIKEIEKRRDLFSKIFWGVIVAFFVSILAGKVF